MVDAVIGSLPIDQPDQQNQYPIDSTNNYPQTPPNVDVSARAARAAMGVKDKTGIDEDQIQNAITSGKEDQIRQQTASTIDSQRLTNAMGLVNTTTDPDQIAQMFQLQDPETVFERHYAKEYMSKIDWPKDPDKSAYDSSNYLTIAGPAPTWENLKSTGEPILALKEYMRTLQEYSPDPQGIEVGANLVADLASLGFYGETRMRQGGALDGLLLGTNIENQTLRLNSLAVTDFEAAKNEVKSTYERLNKTDPVLANRWLSAVRGQSSNERFVNNFFTIANVAGVPGSIPKAARTAIFDMIRTPSRSVRPDVAAAAAAGNVPEATIRQAIHDTAANLRGDQDFEQALRQRLSANFDFDRSQAAADPARVHREQANRVDDVQASARDDQINAIMTALRVNKTPAAVTLESNIRQIQSALADQNRGIQNQVLNVSSPQYVPGLNVYKFDVHIGTHDGDLYRDIDQLRANADKNGLIEKGAFVNPADKNKQTNLQNLIKAFEAQLNISVPTPAPKQGYTRFYRGEKPSAQPFNPNLAVQPGSWYTTDLKEAKNYGQDIYHIDLSPSEMLGTAQDANHPGKPFFILSNNLLNRKQAFVEDTRNTLQSRIDLIRQQIADLPRHETGYTIGRAQTPEDIFELNRWENEGGSSRVESQGNGYYLIKSVFLTPEESFVRDGLITTALNTVKDFRAAKESGSVSTSIPLFTNWRSGWINGTLGRFRSPAERLSIEENKNRLIATHGPGVLLGIGEKTGKPLRNVPRRDWEPFNRMLRDNQSAYNEETKSPGVWFDHPSQVNDWFQEIYGRNAHPNTIDAYFAYKALGVQDLNMRDLLVGQRKLESGFVLNNFKYTDNEGKQQETGFIEGARRYELPDDFKYMMVVGNNKQSTKTMRSKFYKPELRATIEQDIKTGKAKLIQIADPKSRPMADLSDKRVEYVLAYGNRHQEKPIPPTGHVNRLGGGHLMPEWNWYIKQAHIDDGVYEGDKTLLNFLTRAQAQEAIPALEKVRQAFQVYSRNAGDAADIARWESEGGSVIPSHLDAAVEANRATGIPFDKHYNWYFGKNKLLSLNEPLHVVPKDTKLLETEHGEAIKARNRRVITDSEGNTHEVQLVDGTRGDGSLLGKAMVEFTQDRDAEGIYTMKNKGTQQNPIFAYQPAPYLDPITAMRRGYDRIAKTMYMSDMQDYSREHWLHQAAPFLDTGGEDAVKAVRENPFQHFYDPKYKKGIDKRLIWQLEANRKQAIDFIGIPSDVQKGLRGIGQDLADSIYRNFGENKLTVPLMSALPNMRNPVSVIRNLTFNAVLGAFSLPSLFTQASTFANVLAISPRHAPAAAIASLLYGYSKINRTPEMLDHLDSIASNFGWKSGDFKDFIQQMESTGFHRTGNEHAFASNAFGDKIIKNGAMTLLDWSRLPFNLGAGFTKIGSFATAYLEHRAINPFGVVDRGRVLQRAALLDHNMSSAFNTRLQTGAWGIPMQFEAYDQRLSEMMLGKNLTRAEKTRLFAMSAIMFGAAGGAFTTIGLPVANYIQGKLSNQVGYVPGENPMADIIGAGVPAVIGKYLTGSGDYSKGTLYNVQKWGNKGIDWLEQAIEGDKSLRDILLGATGSVFYRTFQNAYGLRSWIYNSAVGNGRPLTVDDLTDIFKEISTVRNTNRMFYAINNGKWINANGSPIMDMSKTQALVQFITGLSPMQGSDLYVKENMIKEAHDEERWAGNYIANKIRLGVIASRNNETDTFQKYMRQVEIMLQAYIPLERQADVIKKAYESFNQDERSRVNYELLFKNQKNPQLYNRSVQ